MIDMRLGDCMDLMRAAPDKHWDLAIVDSPYGIGFGSVTYTGRGWTRRPPKDWDRSIPEAEYFHELRRVSKDQIIWGGNYFAPHLPASMGWIFWDKGQRDFSLADGELTWTSFNVALRAFNFSRAEALQEGKQHPTQKPVALYKWLLSRYARPGWKILDTHGGSGSIAIACHDLGYDLTWIEKDEDYYKAAVQRYKEHASQAFLFAPEPVKKPVQVDLC